MFVGCQDYDLGVTSDTFAKKEFTENFEKAFGKIDPTQDWSIATRASVTVSSTEKSNIKVYAKANDTFKLIGDFSEVSGDQTLYFDVKKDVNELMVSNGISAQRTVIGGHVSFAGTRGGNYSSAFVSACDNDELIHTFTRAEVMAYQDVLPEVAEPGKSNGLTEIINDQLVNLNKVTQDFKYVSTGDFYLYPVFCIGNPSDVVGIYYKDGDEVKTFDVYTWNSSEEMKIGIWGSWVGQGDVWSDINKIGYDYEAAGYVLNETFKPAVWEEKVAPEGTNDGYVNGGFYKYNTTTSEFEWQTEGQSLADGTHYLTLKTSSQTRTMTWTKPSGSDLWDEGVAGGDGVDQFEVLVSTPIKISLPAGTEFGMYISNGSKKFYSESAMNDDYSYEFTLASGPHTNGKYLNGDEAGNQHVVSATKSTRRACHVATFVHNDETYIGFEDWDNAYATSDMDLNDCIMILRGAKPVVIEDDPQNYEWIVACEDLGDTHDIDFNDVVFKVSHISGREYAYFTPLAAGGTLESVVYFGENPIGEIHQLLNGSAPSIINAMTSGSRNEKSGPSITLTVAPEFTMANLAEVADGSAASQNMGGFSVHTGSNLSSTASTHIIKGGNIGAAPQMICLPAYYSRPLANGDTEVGDWRWPIEEQYILEAYNEEGHAFKDWVNNSTINDWYCYYSDASKVVAGSSKVVPAGTPVGPTPSGSTTLTFAKKAYDSWSYGECSYVVSGPTSAFVAGKTLSIVVDGQASPNIDLGTSYGGKEIKQACGTSYELTQSDIDKMSTEGETTSFYLTTWDCGDGTLSSVTISQ